MAKLDHQLAKFQKECWHFVSMCWLWKYSSVAKIKSSVSKVGLAVDRISKMLPCFIFCWFFFFVNFKNVCWLENQIFSWKHFTFSLDKIGLVVTKFQSNSDLFVDGKNFCQLAKFRKCWFFFGVCGRVLVFYSWISKIFVSWKIAFLNRKIYTFSC